MSRMKTVVISAYTLIIVLFAAAIFYYGWKENEREVREKDMFLEEGTGEGTRIAEGTEQIMKEKKETAVEKQDAAGRNTGVENTEMDQPESTEAVSENGRIGKDTVYQLEIYDIFTQELTVEEGEVPPGFIGMTREELKQYWADYTADLPITEFEKGLLSCDLMSFSSDRVTVRKTYEGSGLKYRYYLILEQGSLSVYYSDKKTPYEHTDIMEEDLPEEEAEKLKQGVYVEDEESLYGMLESYTS